MDEYTGTTRNWLDERYRQVSNEGVYHAHQPIYGFRDANSDDGKLEEYIRSYRILKALSPMRFDTLLDVGGGEGFTAYLVKNILGKDATSCDLSEQACGRARDILGVPAQAADVHHLPFRDGQFDVVICSETLEHVTDVDLALAELLRVADKALIITVPLDSEEKVEEKVRSGEPHAHIHAFTEERFNSFSKEGLLVNTEGVVSSPLVLAYGLVEGRTFDVSPSSYPAPFVALYRMAVPFFRRFYAPLARLVFRDRTAAAIIRLDGKACRFLQRWKGIMVTMVKDDEVLSGGGEREVSPVMLLRCKVPHHYLDRQPLDIP